MRDRPEIAPGIRRLDPQLTPHEREQLYHGDEPEGDGSPMGLVVLAASIGAALIVAGAVALAMQAGWLP